MRKIIFAVAIAIAVSGCEEHTEAAAKITEPAARATALGLIAGGTVISSHATSDHHQPTYSFNIQRPGVSGVEKVNINALTGKFISMRHETPEEEEIEASQEPTPGRH